MKLVLKIVLFSLMGLIVSAQQKSSLINGRVISFEESFPIEGVSISVKGTKNFTGTQVDGTFTLVLQPTDSIIVISYEGYISQEIKINTGKNNYDIVLRRVGNLSEFTEISPILRNQGNESVILKGWPRADFLKLYED